MQIDAAALGPQQAYKLLTGAVVPRPIAWVTSLSPQRVLNLAPFSAFTFVSTKPPMIGINIGRKAGVMKDTGANIHATGEFVVNIPDADLIEAVHLSAVEHPPEISEPELLGLQTLASVFVQVPRLAAAPIAMECKLHRAIAFGDTGSEFVVGEIRMFHVRDGLGENGRIDAARLRPICRLGGPNYGLLGEIVRLAPVAQTPKTVLKG
ncbi:MAG TPA: flavin reductase family protein [Burkholderiaceae bacterium]|jgi:flavin reductase (DIM6/NTAB) family NADH-FMN oxidoreductase RutF|nr:flavin reductase family protein [Burkholderiaceae bacterium]